MIAQFDILSLIDTLNINPKSDIKIKSPTLYYDLIETIPTLPENNSSSNVLQQLLKNIKIEPSSKEKSILDPQLENNTSKQHLSLNEDNLPYQENITDTNIILNINNSPKEDAPKNNIINDLQHVFKNNKSEVKLSLNEKILPYQEKISKYDTKNINNLPKEDALKNNIINDLQHVFKNNKSEVKSSLNENILPYQEKISKYGSENINNLPKEDAPENNIINDLQHVSKNNKSEVKLSINIQKSNENKVDTLKLYVRNYKKLNNDIKCFREDVVDHILNISFPKVITNIISNYDYYFSGKISKTITDDIKNLTLNEVHSISNTKIANSFNNSPILRVCDLKTSNIIYYTPNEEHIIKNFIILNENKILILTNHNSLQILNLKTKEYNELLSRQPHKINSILILTDGHLLILSSKSIYILDPENGDIKNIDLTDTQYYEDSKVTVLNNSGFAVTSSDGYLRIYDRETGNINKFKRESCANTMMLSKPFQLSNGNIIYSEYGGCVNIVDIKKNVFIKQFIGGTYWGYFDPIPISHDKLLIIEESGLKDIGKNAYIWNLSENKGTEKIIFGSLREGIKSISTLPDNRICLIKRISTGTTSKITLRVLNIDNKSIDHDIDITDSIKQLNQQNAQKYDKHEFTTTLLLKNGSIVIFYENGTLQLLK